MRVEQEVSLLVKSSALSPIEISNRTGLMADESRIRGSHLSVAGEPRPKAHLWTLKSGLKLTDNVEDQIHALIARVGASADAVGSLVTVETRSFLYVVRRYYAGNEHPSLGFFISNETLDFLSTTKATIDFDEYDYIDP
jgi:hypothetical protein